MLDRREGRVVGVVGGKACGCLEHDAHKIVVALHLGGCFGSTLVGLIVESILVCSLFCVVLLYEDLVKGTLRREGVLRHLSKI